jgi:hypothetical protein
MFWISAIITYALQKQKQKTVHSKLDQHLEVQMADLQPKSEADREKPKMREEKLRATQRGEVLPEQDREVPQPKFPTIDRSEVHGC